MPVCRRETKGGFGVERVRPFARVRDLVCGLVVVAVLIGSSGRGSLFGATAPRRGGTMTVAFTSEPAGLDPFYSAGQPASLATELTHERLLTFDAKGDVVPQLAESFQLRNPTTYVFALRRGVKFHDGTPLTADIVAWNFNFMIDPKNATRVGSQLAVIKSVKALDSLRVQFDLKNPSAALPVLLASWAAKIKSKAAWEKYGKDGSAEHPAGTGPFILLQWRKGDRLVYIRNPNYWRTGLPHLDRVVLRVIPDASVQLASLLSGAVDLIGTAPRSELARLGRNPQVTVHMGEGWQEEILWFNNLKPPFNDPKVRRALAKAIDRKGIVDTLFFGTSTPGSAGIPPSSWAFKPGLNQSSYDPEGAKALLKEAGHENGFSAELLTNTRQPEFRQEATLIQAYLSKVGVQANIKVVETGAWFDRVLAKQPDYDMTLSEWGVNPDPDEFLSINLKSDGLYAIARHQIPGLDELLVQGVAASDLATRKAVYWKIQDLVDTNVPMVFLHHRNEVKVTRSYVKNFSTRGNFLVVLTEVWLDKQQ